MDSVQNSEKILNRDTGLVLTASFLYMASNMLITPIITGYSESLGAGGNIMGFIGGLCNLTSLVCRPISGNLSDRTSKYRLAFIGTGFLLLSYLGYLISVNNLILMLFRIVSGIGFSFCSVAMSTWMSELLPVSRLGSGMGIYGTMNALGMAVAPALGVSIMKSAGYKPAFLVSVGFALLSMLTIQFVGNRGEAEFRPDAVQGGFRVADKKILPIAVIVMLFSMPYCATQAFLVRYAAVRELAVSVSLFFPAYAVVLFILRVSLKGLFDRVSYGVFTAAGSVCLVCTTLCLHFMKNNLLLLAGAFFMACSYGIMCTESQSVAILLAGKGRRGIANSTYYVGLDLGLGIGPVVAGFLYGNLPITYFYPLLLISAPLAFLVYRIFRKNLRLPNLTDRR